MLSCKCYICVCYIFIYNYLLQGGFKKLELTLLDISIPRSSKGLAEMKPSDIQWNTHKGGESNFEVNIFFKI